MSETRRIRVDELARVEGEGALYVRIKDGEVADVEVFGSRLHVMLPDVESGEAAGAARRLADHLAARGVEVESARPGLPSLEDVFIRRIRAAAAPTPDPSEVTR